ncbi:AP-5 complex subunit mu-1 isoform X2 [Protopterus annectens]|uniref:AP-5 complex subunit mu-1 isoform X2 n=1 Tax=Protopterus annectens TaxID=7888 RepID=UPI001CFB3588|nr:AP-5 complex subunit mu-1 isoform X2 [Protopterus annectens]
MAENWHFLPEEAGKTLQVLGRYPTVEKRARSFNKECYVAVPEDGPFLQALLAELEMTDAEKNFLEYRDSCSRINKTSVYELLLEGGTLWPVLAIQHSGLIFACLSLVEQQLKPHPPLISIRGISHAFALLSGLITFLISGQKNETELSTKCTQIPAFLAQACPFGTPTDTNFGYVNIVSSSIMQTMGSSSPIQKPPAWKPVGYKGKPQVFVGVTEQVKSMQYDQQGLIDMWQVYGTVSCKCDLEGILPTVTINLNLPPNGSPLQDILVHPCVTSVDSSIITSSSVDEASDSAFTGPYKFPFSPPLDLFHLCYYTSQVPVPPILGFYQLKDEESQVKLVVNLKLHESIKNGFEFCDAHIPLFNRGQIANVEYKVSTGHLEVLKEKSLLFWHIGQKFPKTLEVSLSGTVTFGVESANHVQPPTDPLCTGLTTYIKLHFRIPDFTLTGCYVDQHAVQVYSSAKPKITTSHDLVSSEYYIWNSKGEAPAVCRSLTLQPS